MTLMIKPLKVVHGSEIRNIDNLFKNTSNEQIDKIIDDIENERIAYSTWKRVDTGDGKKKVSLVVVDISKQHYKETCLFNFTV